MTLADALKKIKETNGRFFGVTFVKRTTGQLRHMVCRTGVRSRSKGGELKFSPKEHGLVLVFDVQKDEYRMIPEEGIVDVVINKYFYKVEPPCLTLDEKLKQDTQLSIELASAKTTP